MPGADLPARPGPCAPLCPVLARLNATISPSPARVALLILPAIVLSQLAGTSLWFGANAVLPGLQREFDLGSAGVSVLLASVNAGFIIGTLCFALLMIADRFSPQRVFVISALLAAACNLLPLLPGAGATVLYGSRLAVGFLLAGIYPVGMKIAASWTRHGLGTALGFLIGALMLGTAMPHAVAGLGGQWPWRQTLLSLSVITVAGALIMLLCVPDGPYLRRSGPVDLRRLSAIWRDRKVRASAFGYFGHMFELYAMLAAVPLILMAYLHTRMTPAISLFSAIVIGSGALGCIVGGLVARRVGSARVAFFQLAVSGLCCLLTPLVFAGPWWLFAIWLLAWGITVGGDSPQFSALTTVNSPPDAVGSILTMVNCVGFAISVVTIALTSWALTHFEPQQVLPFLALGPVFGLLALRPLLARAQAGG